MERALILFFTTVMVFVAQGQEFNITRTDCGVTKLCVETPADCDPAGNSTCLFGSANASTPVPSNGVDIAFELSGNSSGFIALGLTANASEGTSMLFACAQNTSGFFFRTLTLNNNNNTLTSLTRDVTDVRGKVNGDMIQCQFTVPNLNASNTRSAHVTTFVILLGSGTVDGETLGNFTITLREGPLNLADPASNTGTTSGATRALHSQAVLLLLSMLTLSFLKMA